MEYLAPSLEFLRKLQAELQSGKAISSALSDLICEQHNEFYLRMGRWWFNHQNGRSTDSHFPTTYQKTLITILESGLAGAPIFEHLEELEVEMSMELKRQIQAHLDSLAFKLLLPLMLFYFPAFVVLLFGPLLNQFLLEVGL